MNVVLYGKHWRHLFATLVPGTSKHGDKRLSHHVTNAPPTFLRALLDGWYDGDGWVRRRIEHESRDGITVSRYLAADMHAIATALGFRPAITYSEPYLNKHAKTRQARWNIYLPIHGETDPVEEILPNYCMCGCNELVPEERRHRTVRYITGHNLRSQAWRNSQQDSRYMWRRVRRIEEEPFDGEYVFNMHVEGDESFVADGIGVHNCTGWGLAHELAAGPVMFPNIDNAYALARYRRNQEVDREMGHRFTSGATVMATMKAAQADGLITGYRWCFGVDDCVDTLVSTGPVCLGIPWYSSMYSTQPDGRVNVRGDEVGGHFITLLAYSEHPLWGPVVGWLNSWGLKYGVSEPRLKVHGGIGWLILRDLASLLSRNGEAVAPADYFIPRQAPYFSGGAKATTFHDNHPQMRRVREFGTYAEAEAAGLKPCRVCKPTP